MVAARKILSAAAGVFPLKPLIRLSGQRTIFPLYHAVSDSPPLHLKHLYRIRSVKEFRADIEYLCRHYEPLSPELLSSPGELPGRKKPGFILSFDDGLREVADTVEPILREKASGLYFS